MIRILAAALLLGLSLQPRHAAAERLLVFAAASLKNAVEDISAAWEAETGVNAVASFAGSSALARQIQQGAPADIFISANPEWMDTLERDGLIAASSRFDVAGNSLALIAHGGAVAPAALAPGFDLKARLGDGRIAMALVDAVPAGIYGKAALTWLGAWEGVKSKVAQTDNVRTALAFVAAGEAALGVVYLTDAAASDAVNVIGVFPPEAHPPIVYPAAKIQDSRSSAADGFLDFLRGDRARAILARHGFTTF